MTLDTPLSKAGRAFSLYAKKVEKLGIHTLEDLLTHFPSRYEDYTKVMNIGTAVAGEVVTIKGAITDIQNVYARKRFQIQKALISDDTGTIECVWFNQPYVTRNLKIGSTLSVAGRVERFGSKSTIQVKDYEVIPDIYAPTTHTGALVPVYPETRGVSSKWIRNRIKSILETSDIILNDHLPESLMAANKLLPINEALHRIHFPTSLDEAEKARKRFAYDELFLIQLGSIHRKKEWTKKKKTHKFDIQKFQDKLNRLYTSLPFTLTNAQKKAIEEMLSDMSKSTPMNRLLQGDVGSGKTVVAAVGMYLAHLNGYQSALMAPTQILAEQHYATIKRILEPLGVTVEIVTGSKDKKNGGHSSKSKTHTESEPEHTRMTEKDSYSPAILIGTHALIHNSDAYNNLGFVIVDEQHRFGVHQRGILRDKGSAPHFLSMTATPIPRTIFLTMYGDLELSMLDELPHGRLRIKTWLTPNHKRTAAYEWIKSNVLQKDDRDNFNQVFIVCPFIEESESMQSVRAAVKEFEYLQKSVFPELKLGLLHGKMKAKEKQEVLDQFQAGKLHILVSTPVVEVGIDVPNATIMVIEAAERFGLASLHQLRGRVGRSDKQSYCLLFTESENSKTTSRLKALETNHTGAALAEIDLRQRGAGDMYGTVQHGSRMLKVASFADSELIHLSQQDARTIYNMLAKYPILQEKLKSTIIHTRVNPD